VQRFLGALEVAEQADQRREYAARILAVDLVDLRADARDFCCGHARILKGCGPRCSRLVAFAISCHRKRAAPQCNQV
jgi:hypothetical protein